MREPGRRRFRPLRGSTVHYCPPDSRLMSNIYGARLMVTEIRETMQDSHVVAKLVHNALAIIADRIAPLTPPARNARGGFRHG